MLLGLFIFKLHQSVCCSKCFVCVAVIINLYVVLMYSCVDNHDHGQKSVLPKEECKDMLAVCKSIPTTSSRYMRNMGSVITTYLYPRDQGPELL